MVEIAGRVSRNFNASIQNAQRQLGGFGNVLKKVSIAAAATLAAKKGMDFIGSAVNTYAEFEQSLTNAAALAGATAEEYAAMEAAAMEAGKRTTKTAAEASEALGYMALAGWDVQTSIDALMPVLRLSEATQMDLATTSDLVTDSMSALGIAQEDLAKYLNVATAAGVKSNQTTQQMMEAYISAGQSLKDLGITVEDYSTALGVLANRGTKGSEAGTAVKAVVTNIKNQAEALGKVGIQVYDAQGNFKGLTAILKDVNRISKEYTTQQKDALYLSIAGKNHIGSFNKIMMGLNTTTADGVSEWEALNEALYHSDGALDTMAGTMTDTIQGAIAVLGSAMDDFKINFIAKFGEPIKNGIFAAANAIPVITEKMNQVIDALPGFIAEHQTAITVVSGFAAAIAGIKLTMFLVTLGKATVALTLNRIAMAKSAAETLALKAMYAKDAIARGISTTATIAHTAAQTAQNVVMGAGAVAANALGAAFRFMTGPIGIAITIIGALIAVGVALYKNWDTVKAKAAELWAKVKEVFGGIGEAISGAFEAGKEKVAEFFKWIGDKLHWLDEKVSSIPLLGSVYSGVKGGLGWVGSKLAAHPVPAMANGGVVTAPTLSLIGEGREPEAVLPLSKLERMLDGISASGGGSITFSPRIEINGNADKNEVVSAVRASYDDFKRFMDRYLKDNRRVAL